MLSCRRASCLAVRKAWARQCQGAAVAGRFTITSGFDSRRCLFSSLPEHTVVGMPALSPTMTHGNIGSWAKEVGDEIAAGDIVCEVETDKATVTFDAQDDAIMAKHLVDAGAQDIAVGTPIFVTVDEAADVAAFKDFTVEAETAPPAAEAAEPTPVVEKAAAAPVPAPAAPAPPISPVPAAAPLPATAAPAVEAPAPVVSVEASGSGATLVFKRDWGSGVKGSPLAHRLSADQKKYVERFGSALQEPLDI